MFDHSFGSGCGDAVPNPRLSAIGLTEAGLVLGHGSILVRMTKDGGSSCLDLAADRDRLLALLSVAQGRPVSDAVLHPIEAAADYWANGDKALANLRLVFSSLPRLADNTAADCLALAADVLDGGLAPEALMDALWPSSEALRRYSPRQPRVPAGSGAESGRWTVATGATPASGSDGRLVVAENDEPPPSPEEGLPHAERDIGIAPPGLLGPVRTRYFHPSGGAPAGGFTPNRLGDVSAAVRAAVEAAGPGQGAVYGTTVHTELKERIRALDQPDLHAEKSYLGGRVVNHGTPGSIRADVIEGTMEEPSIVYDLKTGDARLSDARVKQLRSHLPQGVSILEIKP